MTQKDKTVIFKKTCPECGGFDFKTVNGNKVCLHCGLVLETTLSYTGGIKFVPAGFRIIKVGEYDIKRKRE